MRTVLTHPGRLQNYITVTTGDKHTTTSVAFIWYEWNYKDNFKLKNCGSGETDEA
jgi:hypothetical protein